MNEDLEQASAVVRRIEETGPGTDASDVMVDEVEEFSEQHLPGEASQEMSMNAKRSPSWRFSLAGILVVISLVCATLGLFNATSPTTMVIVFVVFCFAVFIALK